MGGLLIRDILANDPEKTVSFRKFVLQPRNHAGQLRRWLDGNGFQIVRNQLVREGKFICEVITVLPPSVLSETQPELSGDRDAVWDLPPDLFETQPELASEFAAVKLAVEQKILDGMGRGGNVAQDEIETVKQRAAYFEEYARGTAATGSGS